MMPGVPGVPGRRSFGYVRYGTVDLLAALNIATGKVIGKLSAQHRAVDFRDFLDQIDRQTDPGLEVHVICDNLSAHKAPVVHKWLLAHPRFQLHFTPTYSSWINQVERWFGLLTDKLIRRGLRIYERRQRLLGLETRRRQQVEPELGAGAKRRADTVVLVTLGRRCGRRPTEHQHVGMDERQILPLLRGEVRPRRGVTRLGAVIHLSCPQSLGGDDECTVSGRVEPSGTGSAH